MQNDNIEIPNLNKDFTLSQQQRLAQKAQEDQARDALIQQIKDKEEKSRIETMTQTRDKEVARDVRLKAEEQAKVVQAEIQKRLDAQKAPKLSHRLYKSFTGQSPEMVADKTMAEFKAKNENELAGYKAGAEETWNKLIDKKIDNVLQQQQEQDRQKEAESTFEKSATQSRDSSKDAFQTAHNRTGGEKDWRSLMEDRKGKSLEDR